MGLFCICDTMYVHVMNGIILGYLTILLHTYTTQISNSILHVFCVTSGWAEQQALSS